MVERGRKKEGREKGDPNTAKGHQIRDSNQGQLWQVKRYVRSCPIKIYALVSLFYTFPLVQ